MTNSAFCKISTNKHVYAAYVITITCLYNFNPHKPSFYVVKLRFTGVYIILLIYSRKHRLLVLFRTALPRSSTDYPQSMFWGEIWKKYKSFMSEFFQFFLGEIFYIFEYVCFRNVRAKWCLNRIVRKRTFLTCTPDEDSNQPAYQDSNQTARMLRLIWICASRICPKVRFLALRLVQIQT